MGQKKIFFILALLCAVVQGAWADEWDVVYRQTQTKQSDWTALSAGSTTGRTLGSAGNTTYYYVTGNPSFTNSNAGGSGLKIQGTVYLYIPSGKTLTCTGANASGQTGAGAGIELTEGNTLYLIGGGTVNATGGKAANGGNGGNGSNAECTYDESILGGSGGNGGNGGGGAGAGIGTRGANGGNGGAGGQRTGSYGQETTQYGVDGNAGSAGGTAGRMGIVNKMSNTTLNVTGGSAGSNGTGGNRGLTASQHPGSNVYMASGGGGGGAGGFGGAASNIGTGGPGGGGGGGGAAGNVAWVVYTGTANGYYHAGAKGGKGGTNANGTLAPDGTSIELTNPKYADIQAGGLRPNASDYTDDSGWENGNAWHEGGAGSGSGNATTGGSIGTVTIDSTTPEGDWDNICLQTGSKRVNWVHLNDGSTTGKTLGAPGATTYYYVTGNPSFTNSNAGGSGLTIQGTVYLYVPGGATLTCTGANASGTTGGGAGIELTVGNTLYLIGDGTINATGGNAANGGNAGNGGNGSFLEDEWLQAGDGGIGGNGGGGAGAGIGTRGGDGGKNNARPSQDKCTEFRNYSGFNGFNGQNGATAGAMGSIYLYQGSSITVNATGGTAGTAAGSSGGKGLNALDDEGTAQDVYSIAGGAGGGGGGFGGAASDIGTGGPGGGAGGFGGYAGIGDCSSHGFYQAGAYGGKGGQNADGSYGPDGEDNIMNSLLSNLGQTNVKSEDLSGYDNKGWYTSDATTWCGRGGKPGTYGDAATSGSIGTVTVDWTTQEDDWGLVCLKTGSTRADWVPLADNSPTGKTLGAVGSTTYYYTLFDRTFTNSNAGGSGLTILGTVYLYIPSGKTITCTGNNASGAIGGGAGIELTAGNTLYLIGGGTINATGGNAANGCNGGAGGDANFSVDGWVVSGAGGKGGDGGGGAGAGIGTCGGAGGAGGTGGASNKVNLHGEPTGNVGGNGASGSTAAAEMGTLYIYQLPAPTTEFHGGSGGIASDNGGNGGRHALYKETVFLSTYTWSIGGGGGGGGGGFGGAASDIGTGGPGGGGGGGGASGSIQWKDGGFSFYQVGALGGSPGTNVDGTLAGAGESTLMVSAKKDDLARKYPENDYFENKGWQDDTDNRAAGGNGNVGGSASTSGTANTVTAGWPTQGLGTEGAPFIISNTTDWNEFANFVNGKYTFSGQFVKLSSNISVSNMAGSSDAKSFQGTFDGDGKTLTFNKGTEEIPFTEQYCAPFRHVKNATIKNLHVAGTIYTSAKKAAGFVGESHGALTLTGCRSSIAINSSINGDGTHGGLVSTLSGSDNTITIEGCVFDGSFATTAGTNNCGGFIGWGVYNKPTIKNSLMKPGSVAAGMLNSTFARWYTGNEGIYEPTIDNCYYVATDNLPTNQGTPAVVSLPDVGSLVQDYGIVKAYEHGIYYGGIYYLDPDKLSGYRMLNTATAEDVGKVVCAAGHLHDAKTPVPEGCTAVGILGKVTSTGNGLILALQDATPQTWNTINSWEPVTGYAGTTLKLLPDDAARGSLASYTSLGVVSVSDWGVAQMRDYQAIFTNLGSKTSDSYGTTYDANVNAYITGAGGTALSVVHWSTTEKSSNVGWYFNNLYWYYDVKTTTNFVRPVLGFAASAITVTLADNADNSTTINDANGYFADVTLSGRTLYKDGAWNTLCLPFNVDNFTGTPLEGATVKTLASTDFSGGTLTMNFSDDVTSIEAGKPYIVKWANGTDIVDPVFNGVTISNVTANAETNYADFVGTYGPVSIYTAEKTNLYLGADNMLYYPTDENFKVNAFRGYFQLKGLTAGEPTNSNQASISAFKLNFGDGDDNATGIITTNSTNSDNAWYSLDGRRLNGKPSRAGIYINNGKKVAIK